MVETEPESDADRVRISEHAFQVAKLELAYAREAVREYERTHTVQSPLFVRDGKMFAAMNGRHDMVHAGLRDTEECARQRFCEAQAVRAEMRKRAGL